MMIMMRQKLGTEEWAWLSGIAKCHAWKPVQAFLVPCPAWCLAVSSSFRPPLSLLAYAGSWLCPVPMSVARPSLLPLRCLINIKRRTVDDHYEQGFTKGCRARGVPDKCHVFRIDPTHGMHLYYWMKKAAESLIAYSREAVFLRVTDRRTENRPWGAILPFTSKRRFASQKL